MLDRQYNALSRYASRVMQTKYLSPLVTPADLVNEAFLLVGGTNEMAIKKTIVSLAYKEQEQAIGRVPLSVAEFNSKDRALVETSRTCKVCGEQKGFDGFPKKSSAHGNRYGYTCKSCDNIRRKKANRISMQDPTEREKRRLYHQNRWAQLKQDPERYEKHRQKYRLNTAARNEKAAVSPAAQRLNFEGVTHKVCTWCHRDLPVDRFRSRIRLDGSVYYNPFCRQCANQKLRQQIQSDPVRLQQDILRASKNNHKRVKDRRQRVISAFFEQLPSKQKTTTVSTSLLTMPSPIAANLNTASLNITVEVVTPELAREIMKLNVSNRPLNIKHVQFLTQQMKLDQWQMAGDPIRISVTNRLLDGQHRLSAVIASGIAQTMVVIRDLPDETFHTMDTGRVRSAGDTLEIGGVANAQQAAAIARLVIVYQTKAYKVTNGDILAFNQQHDLQPYILKAKSWYRDFRLLSVSEYGFLFFILGAIDLTQSLEFLSSVSLGANLSADSPMFSLRKKLDQIKQNKIQTSPQEKMALCFKAWNLYRSSTPVRMLYFNPDREEYPIPE